MSASVTVVLDNGGLAGHMYIKVNLNGNVTYAGYNPLNPPSGYGPGDVLNESQRYNDPTYKNVTQKYESAHTITDQQATDLLDYINRIDANPGTYNAASNNCVDFHITDLQQLYFVIDDFEQLFDATRPDFAPYYEELRGQPPHQPLDRVDGDRLITIE